MKELQALRRKLEAGSDAAADFSLVSLVRALRDNAGSIKEGAHDAVLTTVLSISLWSCSTVSGGLVFHRCWVMVVLDDQHGVLQLASSGAHSLRADMQLDLRMLGVVLVVPVAASWQLSPFVMNYAAVMTPCRRMALLSVLCCCVLQSVRSAVLDLVVELIATSSTFIGNCLQVRCLRHCPSTTQ